jgi:hypothetical protein
MAVFALMAGHVLQGGPGSGRHDAFFTDSIDLHAVTIMGDALYRRYNCPATGCGEREPGDPVTGLAARARLRGRD